MEPRDIDSVVERIIKRAAQDGEFDIDDSRERFRNLGKGTWNENSWLRDYVEREKLDAVGALSPTLALRKEFEGLTQRCEELISEARVRDLVRDYNRRVLDDRRRPVVGPTSPPVAPIVDEETFVAEWRLNGEELSTAQDNGVDNHVSTQRTAAKTRKSLWDRLRSSINGGPSDF